MTGSPLQAIKRLKLLLSELFILLKAYMYRIITLENIFNTSISVPRKLTVLPEQSHRPRSSHSCGLAFSSWCLLQEAPKLKHCSKEILVPFIYKGGVAICSRRIIWPQTLMRHIYTHSFSIPVMKKSPSLHSETHEYIDQIQ